MRFCSPPKVKKESKQKRQSGLGKEEGTGEINGERRVCVRVCLKREKLNSCWTHFIFIFPYMLFLLSTLYHRARIT